MTYVFEMKERDCARHAVNVVSNVLNAHLKHTGMYSYSTYSMIQSTVRVAHVEMETQCPQHAMLIHRLNIT